MYLPEEGPRRNLQDIGNYTLICTEIKPRTVYYCHAKYRVHVTFQLPDNPLQVYSTDTLKCY